MGRRSSFEKLDPAIRDEIGALRERGATTDEIVAHLRAMDIEVSRSAAGRYLKDIDTIGAELRRSRAIAEALVRNTDDAPESKIARLNIEVLHGQISDLMSREKVSAKTGMMLSVAVEKLAKASRLDIDAIMQIEKRAAAKAQRDAAKAVDKIARANGVSKETRAAIVNGILVGDA